MKKVIKYPIGTRWYNPEPSKAKVWYWIIIKWEGDECMMKACRMPDGQQRPGAYKRTPDSLIATGWIIEYPKEDNFTKLYLTLKQ